jgi:hypothetical protein
VTNPLDDPDEEMITVPLRLALDAWAWAVEALDQLPLDQLPDPPVRERVRRNLDRLGGILGAER